MKIKVWFALALLVVCTSAVAQDQKAKQMSPEEIAWMRYMTPGEGHKALDNMVGTWDAKVMAWMAPGTEAASSTGLETDTWVLGGRYVEQKFSGTFMGQPFNGIGYTGYDNAKKEYFGTWMDTMGTGVMTQTGKSMDGGKSFTFKSNMTDPITGKDQAGEMRVNVPDKDHHSMELWGPGPDGKMFKMMQIDYTRKK